MATGVNAADSTINFDQLIGVFSTEQAVRLDIGTWAMQQNTPAAENNDYTQVYVYKLKANGAPDTSDNGALSSGDKIGIFSKNMQCRVDLGFFATKENVPASHKSWATQLHIVRQDGTSRGDVRYGDLVGLFSSGNNKAFRLSMAPPATKNCNNVSQAAGSCYKPKGCVSASHASWATVLKIAPAN